MNEDEIYEQLAELKESFDRIFEYLPANEAGDTDQQLKEMQQQETGKSTMNQLQNQQQQQQYQQQNQKQNQQKEKLHPQKIDKSKIQKFRSKPKDLKIRPGFEGPKIIRTKRQSKNP